MLCYVNLAIPWISFVHLKLKCKKTLPPKYGKKNVHAETFKLSFFSYLSLLCCELYQAPTGLFLIKLCFF